MSLVRHLLIAACALLAACQAPLDSMGRPPKPAPKSVEPRVAPGPVYAIQSDASADFEPGVAKQFACNGELETKSEVLGGLRPKLPMAVCHRFWQSPDYAAANGESPAPGPEPGPTPTPLPEGPLKPWPSFLMGGVSHIVYLVKAPEGIRVLGSQEQVRSFYAPIESEAEALSYLFAVRDAIKPLNNKTLPDPGEAFWTDAASPPQWMFYEGAVYRVAKLEATRVEVQGQGFMVRNVLRDSECRPTGQDTVAANVDYRISRDGQIEEVAKTDIFSYGPCPIE